MATEHSLPSSALVERYRIRILTAYLDGVSSNGGGPGPGIAFQLREFAAEVLRESGESVHRNRDMLKLTNKRK